MSNINNCSIALFVAFFIASQAIAALADGSITVANDFNSDALEGVRFVMSGHEHRRIHVEDKKLVLGVRDTLLTENEYIPTEEKPLEMSLVANFQDHDALYLLTRSQGTTDIGGYRSNDEVRVLIDSAERLISINEVHGGKIKVVGQINDVVIPLNRDIPIRLKDNGHSVTITLGEYTVSASPQGSYPKYFAGISNWAKIVTVDNLIIAHGAEIPPSQDEDEFIIDTKLSNQALQRLQGAQLLEKSVFAISGNDIGDILQERMPDIFPENLQLAVIQWAQRTGEPGGRYQDSLLRQQSEYRGILRSLLGSYDSNMIDLLNYAIERVVRIQFGESEHDLLQEIRDRVAALKRTRYIIELASFGINLPSPEALYREAQRLFTDEQAILRHMQEEDARLDEKDQLLASDREWQLLHNISDLNDTGRGISEDEQRRLDRAQRRMQEALRIRSQGQEDAPLTFGQPIVIDPAIFVFPDKNTPLKEKESERHTTYQWAGPEEDSSDYMMWEDNKYNDSIIIKAVVPKTDTSDDELPSLNMFSPDMAYSEYYIRANIPNGGLKPPYLVSARAFRDMRETLPDDFENILRKCPILGYIPYYTELAGNACKASEDCFYDEGMAWCASEIGIVAMPTLSLSDVQKGIQNVSQYSVRIIKPGKDWPPFYQRFHKTPSYPDIILMLFKGEAQKNSLTSDTFENDWQDKLKKALSEEKQRRLEGAQRLIQKVLESAPPVDVIEPGEPTEIQEYRLQNGEDDADLEFGKSITIDMSVFTLPDTLPLEESQAVDADSFEDSTEDSSGATEFHWVRTEGEQEYFLVWFDEQAQEYRLSKTVVSNTESGIKSFFDKCSWVIVPGVDMIGDGCQTVIDCAFKQDIGWCALDIGLIMLPVGNAKGAHIIAWMLKLGEEGVAFSRKFHRADNFVWMVNSLYTKGDDIAKRTLQVVNKINPARLSKKLIDAMSAIAGKYDEGHAIFNGLKDIADTPGSEKLIRDFGEAITTGGDVIGKEHAILSMSKLKKQGEKLLEIEHSTTIMLKDGHFWKMDLLSMKKNGDIIGTEFKGGKSYESFMQQVEKLYTMKKMGKITNGRVVLETPLDVGYFKALNEKITEYGFELFGNGVD